MKVFVYGTLKSGHGNHKAYLYQSPLVGNASIMGFDLYDLGCFPAIVKNSTEGRRVFGELYEVTPAVAKQLDGLEGYRPDGSGLYDKTLVTAELEDGTTFEDVLVYHMHVPPTRAELLTLGVWP